MRGLEPPQAASTPRLPPADRCCYQRDIADELIEGIPIGCFPDLYRALSGAKVDEVITP